MGLRRELEELYAAYVEYLDDGPLERWPELFTDECRYEVVTRENHDRGLPLALVRCESRGMLADRVVAVRQTSVFVARSVRHLVTSIRILNEDAGTVRARAHFALFETPLDEPARVFNVGRYLDVVVRDGGVLRFKEKVCVLDGGVIQGSLIYPV